MSEVPGFEILPLARVGARLVDHRWTWAEENAAWVSENWRRRRTARPALFDGPVLLACGCTVSDGVGTVDLFETTYARFLAYRDRGEPDGRVANAFAAVVPRAADGAVVLGEMGAHTANAGQIYFPCGTPDRDDIRGQGVDLAGSAAREFREETGLDLPADAPDAWALVRGDGQLAFLRPVPFPEEADALAARMERRRAAQAEPELARIVVLRRRADLDGLRMPGFARAYLMGVLP